MASIQETITFLEGLPNDILDHGKYFVQWEILAHNHVRTGRMLNSVQGSASSNFVNIRVWTSYAGYVNDGRGPVYPKHNAKNGYLGWLKWDDGSFHRSAGPYAGSRFFDAAADKLRSYVRTL